MEKANSHLLCCQNLSLEIDGKNVLSEINFSVNSGEIVAFIGPSGGGKTLLFQCLNRMIEQTEKVVPSGNVFFEGQDIYLPDIDVCALRRQIGMIFSQPVPFDMSIYQNLVYGPRLEGTRSKLHLDNLVKKSLEQVGLWEHLKNKLRLNALELKPAQQQKLCIARALCLNPKILLLDDPTVGMDIRQTLEIEQVIHSLQGEYTILLATQSPQQAARISDRCALLVHGAIAEMNITETFFTAPSQLVTERFITGHSG